MNNYLDFSIAKNMFTKKKLFLLFSGLIILISYMKYNEIRFLGKNLALNEVNINNNNYEIIDYSIPLEELIEINQDFLIGYGSKYFYHKLNYFTQQNNNSSLFLYNIKKKSITPIEIRNFPKEISFYPQGLNILKEDKDKYLLYIINHSINSKGNKEERVERVIVNLIYRKKKEEIALIYHNGIILPQQFFGKLNSIYAINYDTFYFTTHIMFALENTVKEELSIYSRIKNGLFNIIEDLLMKLNIKKTYLYSYHDGSINKIDGSGGLSNGGLAFNRKKSILYMARTPEKDVMLFEVSKNFPYKSLFLDCVKTIYNPKNLFFDEDNEKLYLSIHGSQKEIEQLKLYVLSKNNNTNEITTFGGFEEIIPSNNYQIGDIILLKNKFKGISSAIKINDSIFLSSAFQNGLFIYHKK